MSIGNLKVYMEQCYFWGFETALNWEFNWYLDPLISKNPLPNYSVPM